MRDESSDELHSVAARFDRVAAIARGGACVAAFLELIGEAMELCDMSCSVAQRKEHFSTETQLTTAQGLRRVV